MEIKTSELTGAALDWAVAKAIGYKCGLINPDRGIYGCNASDGRQYVIGRIKHETISETLHARYFKPSTDWDQCGPLIDEHGIEFKWVTDATIEAYSYTLSENRVFGLGHLQAACLLLAYELGDTVDVPEELLS